MLLSGNLFLNSFYFPHCVLSQLGDFFYAKVTHQSVHFTLFITELKHCFTEN